MGLPPTGQPAPLGDNEIVLASAPTQVLFNFDGIEPPSPIYVKADDQLVIVWVSSAGGEQVTFSGRLLQATPPPGRSQPDPASPVIASGRIGGGVLTVMSAVSNTGGLYTTNTLTIPLNEGFLLAAGVSVTQATIRGQTYVKMFINRKGSGIGKAQMLIFADYVTTLNGTGWPLGRVVSGVEGGGNIIQKQSTAGGGSDFDYVQPGLSRMRVQCAQVTLATSATVGTRSVQIRVVSGPNQTFITATPITSPASTTTTICLVPGLGAFINTTTFWMVPFPAPLVLGPSDQLASSSTGLFAGDTFTANIAGEEWLDF